MRCDMTKIHDPPPNTMGVRRFGRVDVHDLHYTIHGQGVGITVLENKLSAGMQTNPLDEPGILGNGDVVE